VHVKENAVAPSLTFTPQELQTLDTAFPGPSGANKNAIGGDTTAVRECFDRMGGKVMQGADAISNVRGDIYFTWKPSGVPRSRRHSNK
jgi:hypothetical protein